MFLSVRRDGSRPSLLNTPQAGKPMTVFAEKQSDRVTERRNARKPCVRQSVKAYGYGAVGRDSRMRRRALASMVTLEKRERRPLPRRPDSPAKIEFSWRPVGTLTNLLK